MNKTDLVNAIAEKAGLSKADAQKALEAFCAAVESTLASGNEVRLVGFGTFLTGKRKETEGRNPRTGEKIVIKAKTVAKFKAGRDLQKAVA